MEYTRSNWAQTPLLWVNWVGSTVEVPTMDRVTLPHNAAISRIKAKSETIYEPAMLPLHFFQFSTVHLLSLIVHRQLWQHRRSPVVEEWYNYLYLIQYSSEKYVRTRMSLLMKRSRSTNVCPSEVHLRRSQPTIEEHWGWDAFSRMKFTYNGDTLRSVQCIPGQRLTQFRKLSTTTKMTTMTMMTSEHNDYGQSRWQSATQAPMILRHSAS